MSQLWLAVMALMMKKFLDHHFLLKHQKESKFITKKESCFIILDCVVICHQNELRIAAMKKGTECYCLKDMPQNNLEPVDDDACDVPCVGDKTQICGGDTVANFFVAGNRSEESKESKVQVCRRNTHN